MAPAGTGPCGRVRESMREYTHPSRAQFDALRTLPEEVSFDQLELLRFRATAVYPGGETLAPLTAFARYTEAVFALAHRLGVELVWQGRPHLSVIGPDLERWDLCQVRRFPSLAVYRAFINDTVHAEARAHWRAVVEDARVFCAEPGRA